MKKLHFPIIPVLILFSIILGIFITYLIVGNIIAGLYPQTEDIDALRQGSKIFAFSCFIILPLLGFALSSYGFFTLLNFVIYSLIKQEANSAQKQQTIAKVLTILNYTVIALAWLFIIGGMSIALPVMIRDNFFN